MATESWMDLLSHGKKFDCCRKISLLSGNCFISDGVVHMTVICNFLVAIVKSHMEVGLIIYFFQAYTMMT